MFKVLEPHLMNETFALAFNSRRIESLLALYEPDATLLVDGPGRAYVGASEIAAALGDLLKAPGRMRSLNNYCVRHGNLALLRADYTLTNGAAVIASGSTAEVVRLQADGRWLYVIDHAAGASLPRVG
jgi:ketosteroid isomerase-like protein